MRSSSLPGGSFPHRPTHTLTHPRFGVLSAQPGEDKAVSGHLFAPVTVALAPARSHKVSQTNKTSEGLSRFNSGDACSMVYHSAFCPLRS